jgi:hypothetical protein
MPSVNGGLDPNNPSGGSFLGSLGAQLGTQNQFQAQQAPTVNATYNGPSQGTLQGGANQYLGAANTNAAQVNGADRTANAGYLQSLDALGSSSTAASGMLQAGTNAANASALSLARASGGNAAQQAAALRQAQQQQATNITGAGNQAAQLQAQQAASAAQMQGGVLAGQQAADLQQQQTNAGIGTQYLGSQLQASGQDLGAQESNNEINSGNFNTAQGINAGIAGQNTQANSQMLGGVAGAAAGAMMMSDMNAKASIEPAGGPTPPDPQQQQEQEQEQQGRSMFLKGLSQLSDEDVKGSRSPGTNAADQFLSTLKPYTYEYKRSEDEPTDDPHGGRYLGIMAQNVERGPTGDTLVRDTPRGKAIEGAPSMSAALAGIGRLHERLSALEQASRGHHA